ncbi:MAG: hypothetical protein GXO48_03370 [Chlorobi bacterium]|nr:hypothetical protein [Chlorobiota bacterium]
MELIKKMKISISKLLDSARTLNMQVDTSSVNLILKGAYLDNEFRYWELKYHLEKTQEAKDSLVKFLQTIKAFYDKYGEYDKEGKKGAFLVTVEYRNLIDYDKRKLYDECLEMIDLEHEELKGLAKGMVDIDLPNTSEGDVEKLLGELPYQCNLKYAVSVGLAILFGTLLVLVAFLYSKGRKPRRA